MTIELILLIALFSSASSLKLLVLGGSGYLGREICKAAVSCGHTVTSLSRRGVNPAPGTLLDKVEWVKGNAEDKNLLKSLSTGMDGYVHAIGMLLDSESGLRFANVITSGSGSIPGKGDTYDSVMRGTALNFLEVVSSLPSSTTSPPPFLFVSAAESGWKDNALGTKIENAMKDNGFFLPRYLDAKRAVEEKLLQETNVRPIVARPSFMWDPTKFDILPLLPIWSIGNTLNIGSGTFNPPLKVATAGSAIVQLLQGERTGIVDSGDMEDLATIDAKVSPDEIDVLTSGLASISRLPYGTTSAVGMSKIPRPPSSKIQIYQFEGCPFCRRVREACTYLDIEYTVVPCGRGSRHRKQVENAAALMGRKATYPFMEDLELGVQMFESEDIINHLYKNYGSGLSLPSPSSYFLTSTLTTGWIPSLVRSGRGSTVLRSSQNSQPPPLALVLYDYDGNQFSRLVREALVELDLVHVIKSVGKGSERRDELAGLTGGSTRVPYLVDPNTGVSMAESKDIVEYLFRTYEKGWTGGEKGRALEPTVEEDVVAV